MNSSTGVVAALVALLFGGTAAQDRRADDSARDQIRTARAFVQERKYQEALRDFKAVVNNFPQSSVADDALLEVAQYYLDVAGDIKEARIALDLLEQKYNGSDSTPMGHVVAGRLKTSTAASGADLESAIAEFDRVLRRFPRNDAVPAALFYRAQALRVGGRDEQALADLSTVALSYSGSAWAPEARLAAAKCFVRLRAPLRAIKELQMVRRRYPTSTASATALELNTLLARLYVRLPAAPTYSLGALVAGGRPFRDVVGMSVTRDGDAIVATKGSVGVYDRAGAEGSVNPIPALALGIDPWGHPLVVTELSAVRMGHEGSFPLRWAKPRPKNVSDKVENPKPEYWTLNNPKAVALTATEVVVSDEGRGLVRFSTSGEHLAIIPIRSRADRLIRDELGHLVGLDRAARAIVMLRRDGQADRSPQTRSIPVIKNPVDIAIDAFGHLYVLDRGVPAVHIFHPTGESLGTFSVPEKSPQAFREPSTLAVDGAGRLLIHDDRRKQIMVFE